MLIEAQKVVALLVQPRRHGEVFENLLTVSFVLFFEAYSGFLGFEVSFRPENGVLQIPVWPVESQVYSVLPPPADQEIYDLLNGPAVIEGL